MRRAEGIVDIQLRQIRQRLGKGGIVLRLPGVEPHVFNQHRLAVLQGSDLGMGVIPDDVGGKGHLAVQQLVEPIRHGL